MTELSTPATGEVATATNAATATTQATSRVRADWEAIERDYRTGKFSDQELATKHKNVVTRQAISKMAKRRGWQKDLSAAVRSATNAKLIAAKAEEIIKQQAADGRVAESCDRTLDAVLAAAEVNKQVVLGHRADIRRLSDLTMKLVDAAVQQTEALMKDAKPEKPIDPGPVLLSIQRATQSLARLQAMERTAFGLDEPDDPAGAEVGRSSLTDAQRASRLATLVHKLGHLMTEEGGDGAG